MLSKIPQPHYECDKATITVNFGLKIVKYVFSRRTRNKWLLNIYDDAVLTHQEIDTFENHLEYANRILTAYHKKLGTATNQIMNYENTK
jgi:hypothetical protein